MDQAFTITFGDQAENHKGMQIIGEAQSSGLSRDDMSHLATILSALSVEGRSLAGLKVELVNLHESKEHSDLPHAQVLIIRNGVNAILRHYGKSADDVYAEQLVLPKDKKALMYGKVREKHARHNLCFADFAQEPDYSAGRGRIVPWSSVPLLTRLREFFAVLHPKFKNLAAEGNYYFKPTECGIGYHGDSERRIVVAVRLGVPIPLVYQWYLAGKEIGPKIPIKLAHGDIYIMSEKAVGTDWRKSSLYTLRHAAGAHEYTGI